MSQIYGMLVEVNVTNLLKEKEIGHMCGKQEE